MKRFELSGVYKITNKVNDKFYIGSGYSIFSRWFNHTCDLKNGTHTNYKLQRAFDKYGFNNFTFEIIELHPPEGLNGVEQKFDDTILEKLKQLKSDGNIEVYTLFHEYLGSFSKETVSNFLNSHLHSVSQAVTQCKLLKGFYFIKD